MKLSKLDIDKESKWYRKSYYGYNCEKVMNCYKYHMWQKKMDQICQKFLINTPFVNIPTDKNNMAKSNVYWWWTLLSVSTVQKFIPNIQTLLTDLQVEADRVTEKGQQVKMNIASLKEKIAIARNQANLVGAT